MAAETHLCRHALFEKKQGFDLPQTLELARFAPLFQQVNAFVIPPVGVKGQKKARRHLGGRREVVAVAALIQKKWTTKKKTYKTNTPSRLPWASPRCSARCIRERVLF